MENQTCTFCDDSKSILTKNTTCTRCSKIHLEVKDIENMTIEEMKENMRKMEDIILRQYIELTSIPVVSMNDGFFPPPWNPNDFPEKTEGWIEFQKNMKKAPKYYNFDNI